MNSVIVSCVILKKRETEESKTLRGTSGWAGEKHAHRLWLRQNGKTKIGQRKRDRNMRGKCASFIHFDLQTSVFDNVVSHHQLPLFFSISLSSSCVSACDCSQLFHVVFFLKKRRKKPYHTLIHLAVILTTIWLKSFTISHRTHAHSHTNM